jgi:DNA polymerase-3 subunit gamma/tau
MSYLVFARKYRPQQFEDVVAQQHVTKTLANSVKNSRVGSGYLFCGPRGTGKTTTARILAKCLNCKEGPTPTPCGICDSCKEITSGSSLDVLEIDAASNTGVDDVRTLRENVRYMPAGGKKRIYIIDEVHRLSGSAFDALLKTLEEPPPHVVFVFATTDPFNVPNTIHSRTQRFDFKRVSPTDIAAHIENIAKKEKIDIAPEALRILARKADGSVRDALSLLDQITAFAGDKITERDVINALGLVDKQLLFDFTRAVAAHDSRQALQLTAKVIDEGFDVSDFAKELMEHFRVLMVLAANESAGTELNLSREELQQYREQAGYFSLGDVLRLLKMAGDLHADLKFGLNERLVLEITAVKMAEMEATVKLEEILQHLKSETPQNSGNLFGSAEKKNHETEPIGKVTLTKPPEPPRLIQTPTYTRALNLALVQNQWEEYLNHLKRKSPMLSSQLNMGQLKDVKENQLKVVFPSAVSNSKEILERPENLRTITEDLKQFFQANVSITFEVDKELKLPENKEKKQVTREEINRLVDQSPRLKKLIEKVDGEIIGVRKVE